MSSYFSPTLGWTGAPNAHEWFRAAAEFPGNPRLGGHMDSMATRAPSGPTALVVHIDATEANAEAIAAAVVAVLDDPRYSRLTSARVLVTRSAAPTPLPQMSEAEMADLLARETPLPEDAGILISEERLPPSDSLTPYTITNDEEPDQPEPDPTVYRYPSGAPHEG